ncbi:MAG: RNase J family beta-CASP ribonuclease [Thermomicrobiales bacterium]
MDDNRDQDRAQAAQSNDSNQNTGDAADGQGGGTSRSRPRRRRRRPAATQTNQTAAVASGGDDSASAGEPASGGNDAGANRTQGKQDASPAPASEGSDGEGEGQATSSSSRRRRRRRRGSGSGAGQAAGAEATASTEREADTQAPQRRQQSSQGSRPAQSGAQQGQQNRGRQGGNQQGGQRQGGQQFQSGQQAQAGTGGNRNRGRRGRGGSQADIPASEAVLGPEPGRSVRRPRRDEEPAERVEINRSLHQRGRRSAGGQGAVADRVLTPVSSGDHGIVPMGPIGNDKLRVIPLGGVGEVGKNMTAVECGQDIVLLDCGSKFPEEDQRGIDLVVPDVSFIIERIKNFRGMLITHGHEDHIGGIPHIIPQLKGLVKGPVPIYGTPLAIGFIERKLLEARMEKYVDLIPVNAGETVQIGEMKAEFIHVTHSIPDACAIALHTHVGTILDTGDFKFDPSPVMGDQTDERRLKRLGDRGVLALFSDTVRVETEGSTPSEKVVMDTMVDVVGKAKGQVIIATFASNVSRIHMALEAAARHGRKVAVAGRSMEQNARVSIDLGYLDPPEGLLVPLDDLLKMPKEKRVIVSTGSQGEAAAALARIAAGEHPKIRVGRGDVILVSATPIPGNEDTITKTIDNLYRRGCDVIYSALNKGVHVSGHAGRDELERMIKLVRPKFAVPIHGEFRHMAIYRDLCVKNGIPRDHVLLPEIGGVIEFTKDTANQRGRVKSGNVLVDRLGDRDDSQVVLRTRENLTQDGFVLVTIVLDRQSGELIAGPELVAKGLKPELNQSALREAERELRRTLERRRKGEPQYGYVVQRTKETIGRSLRRRSRSRPLILPVVTEL